MCPGFGGVAILGFRPRVGRVDVTVRTLSECDQRGGLAGVDRPSDYTAGEGVQNNCAVHLALVGAVIRVQSLDE